MDEKSGGSLDKILHKLEEMESEMRRMQSRIDELESSPKTRSEQQVPVEEPAKELYSEQPSEPATQFEPEDKGAQSGPSSLNEILGRKATASQMPSVPPPPVPQKSPRISRSVGSGALSMFGPS